TDELEGVDRLEQLATSDLGRDVVHPHPEAVLDPLKARQRIDGTRLAQGGAKNAASVPENHGILDSMGQILGRHELEVDVEQRWPIERDEEPRLAHEFVSWAHWPLTFSVSRTRNPMWLNPTKPVTTSAIAFTVSILAHASLLP